MQTTSGSMLVLYPAIVPLANSVEVCGRVIIMELLGNGYEGFRAEAAWRNLERPMAGGRTLRRSR